MLLLSPALLRLLLLHAALLLLMLLHSVASPVVARQLAYSGSSITCYLCALCGMLLLLLQCLVLS
jgi:hypothetical protein